MRWIVPALLAGLTPVWATETTPEEGFALGEAPFKQSVAIVCDFTTECVEDETCTETEFTPEITGAAGGMSADELVVEAQMITDAETVELLGLKAGTTLSLSGGSFAARHLLTITDGGATRYTVHYAEGPFVISYLGICN